MNQMTRRTGKGYLRVLNGGQVQTAVEGYQVHVVGQVLLLIGHLIVRSLARRLV